MSTTHKKDLIELSSWINPEEHANRPRRVVVEGLIGAGKTYFSKELAKHLGYELWEEPVEDNHILPLFYEDPKKFGFAMQLHMLRTRLSMERAGTYMVQAGKAKGVIFDRSLGGDTVFLEVNTRIGNIHKEEARIYLELFEQMKIESPYPDLIIYLDVPIETIRARIASRDRPFEQGLVDTNNPYLEMLEEAYKRFCQAMSRHTLVLWVNWVEFRPVADVWKETLEKWNQEAGSRFHKLLMKW